MTDCEELWKVLYVRDGPSPYQLTKGTKTSVPSRPFYSHCCAIEASVAFFVYDPWNLSNSCGNTEYFLCEYWTVESEGKTCSSPVSQLAATPHIRVSSFFFLLFTRYLHSQLPAEDASRNIRYGWPANPGLKKSKKFAAMWWPCWSTWGRLERNLQVLRSTPAPWGLNLQQKSRLLFLPRSSKCFWKTESGYCCY